MESKIYPDTMYDVMQAYANAGDVVGTQNAILKSKSLGIRETPKRTVYTMRSIINSTESDGYDAVIQCYNAHFGHNKYVATDMAYTELLRACEKYNRPTDAIKWFNEALSFGLIVTPPMRDLLRKTLGVEQYEIYINSLDQEYKEALSHVDDKIKPYVLDPYINLIISPAKTSASKDKKVVKVTSGIDKKELIVKSSKEKKELEVNNVAKVAKDAKVVLPSTSPSVISDLATTSTSVVTTKEDSIATVNGSLSEYFLHKDLVKTQKIFDDVKASGTKQPNMSTYRIMCQIYGHAGDGAGVDKMILEAAAAGFEPSKIKIITYALLVCRSVSLCVCVRVF